MKEPTGKRAMVDKSPVKKTPRSYEGKSEGGEVNFSKRTGTPGKLKSRA